MYMMIQPHVKVFFLAKWPSDLWITLCLRHIHIKILPSVVAWLKINSIIVLLTLTNTGIVNVSPYLTNVMFGVICQLARYLSLVIIKSKIMIPLLHNHNYTNLIFIYQSYDYDNCKFSHYFINNHVITIMVILSELLR